MTITKEIKNKAEQLFKKMPNVDKLFVNAKGEFFTREDLCKLSKEKYTAIEKTVKVENEPTVSKLEDLSKEEATTQLEGMKRKQLEEKATELGVLSVEEFPNKASLIEAIVAVLFPKKKEDEEGEEGGAGEGEEGAAEE